MDEDVSVNSGSCVSTNEIYTKEIKFCPDGNVDVSSLSVDEKKSLQLHLEKDVVTRDDAAEKFLRTHDEDHLRDIGVEEMRRTIPKLFMYCDDHDTTSCRKVKGLWDKRPDWWSSDVPFLDPNNRKRSIAQAGMPARKPTKDELQSMLIYLFGLCKNKKCHTAAVPTISSADVASPSPHSVLSCDDSWVASVQTLDDAEADVDCRPSPGPKHSVCLSLRPYTSQCSIHDETQNSNDAENKLNDASRQIIALPPSEDKQLMMEVYDLLKTQSETLLTAQELTQLKQHIQFLLKAASLCHMCESNRQQLFSIKAKYVPCSSSAADVRRNSSGVNDETLSACRQYSSSIAGEPRKSLSDNSEGVADGKSVFRLSADEELTLTDLLEVISCDTVENSDTSTSLTNDHVSYEADIFQLSIQSTPACSASSSDTAVHQNNSEDSASELRADS